MLLQSVKELYSHALDKLPCEVPVIHASALLFVKNYDTTIIKMQRPF